MCVCVYYGRDVQLFAAEPNQVVFTDYQVGHTYQVGVLYTPCVCVYVYTCVCVCACMWVRTCKFNTPTGRSVGTVALLLMTCSGKQADHSTRIIQSQSKDATEKHSLNKHVEVVYIRRLWIPDRPGMYTVVHCVNRTLTIAHKAIGCKGSSFSAHAFTS